MKYRKNDVASFYYSEGVLASIEKICSLLRKYPFVLEPLRGINEEVERLFSSQGFLLYPTVKKTTLFYDQLTDCFFKILQPLTLKYRVFSLLKNRAKSIYRLSEYLLSQGIKVPEVMAYGIFKRERKPFFVARRMKGKPLYDILIREKGTLSKEAYKKVADEVVRFHRFGYWFGDAHLSHIFMNDGAVSGFIDIDSIRKNKPFSIKKLAKDVAGLNHPEVPLTAAEKKELLHYYMEGMNIQNGESFAQLVKLYTVRRWKA